ncbi:hypothetical protein CBF27_11775 [Vagococcus acidifermentans]|uniref:Uncharacterized protein n=1 Tax=Vagococcus acidifermentans TaxID=564710 RepID=A0A430ANX4_9ENTE|nr:hypothetical protein CBF27_11775 [Vagococcus acidifermentans]
MIPLIGQRFSFISNVTLLFDDNYELISYSEALITQTENHKFMITNYLDGKMVEQDITDIDFLNNDEWLSSTRKYIKFEH